MMTDAEIDQFVAAAADMALMFTGTPEQDMLAALFDVREGMKAEMRENFGEDAAKLIAEAFAAAVILRRREIGELAPSVN